MDAQILGISKHFPKHVHISMIPDMTNFARADVDTDAQLNCACSKASSSSTVEEMRQQCIVGKSLLKQFID